jgi:hypothetical protein
MLNISTNIIKTLNGSVYDELVYSKISNDFLKGILPKQIY